MKWVASRWLGERCWRVDTVHKTANKRRCIVYSTSERNAKRIAREHNAKVRR